VIASASRTIKAFAFGAPLIKDKKEKKIGASLIKDKKK